MALDLVQTIESLPGWSEFTTIRVKDGMLRRKHMTPIHRTFWSLWQSDQKLMEELGYKVVKHKNEWYALRFVQWASPKVIQELVQQSEATDHAGRLMVPPGLEYRPFQRAGIKYAIDRLFGIGMTKRDAVMIADDMGLGKTVQALGILNQDHQLRDVRALVICPASLKLNWQDEAAKWLLDGIGSSCVVVKKKWPGLIGTNVVIVNYDILRKFAKEIRAQAWDYVIVDEAHYLKNPDSLRSIYCLGGAKEMQDGRIELAQEIPGKRWVFLTGTPMENGRAAEMFPLIEKCDPMGLGKSRSAFVNRYQRTEEYLEELQTVMRMAFMVRRMKQDVLKELPPKTRQIMKIDPDDCKDVVVFKREMSLFKEYQECLAAWAVKTELAKLQGVEAYRQALKEKKLKLGMQAGELARLRKKTAMAKAPAVVDQLKELLKTKKNMIVFAHHIEVLDCLQQGLEKAGKRVVRVDGSCTPEQRHAAVKAFQAGEADVFLGGIKPAGVGLTLTATDTVAFVELDWLPGAMTQAEDRAHRIGQKNAVLILHMVMEGSLDEYMARRLIEKQDLIDKALNTHSEAVDEDDEDEKNEARDNFAARESIATKGASIAMMEKEAAKIEAEMAELIRSTMRVAIESKTFAGPDMQIANAIMTAGATSGVPLAMARRLLLKYRHTMDEPTAKGISFAKTKEVAK